MATSDFISLKLQNALRDLVRGDWTLGRMDFWRAEFAENPNNQDAISTWQNSVDSIYRCLDSGLIKVLNYDHYSNQDALINGLRKCNPFVYSGKVRADDYAWNGVFVCATDELAAIVERFFQNDDEYATSVNGGFIAAIQKAFEDAGVPWSDKPLMPIVP